jgi:hypothetical protein
MTFPCTSQLIRLMVPSASLVHAKNLPRSGSGMRRCAAFSLPASCFDFGLPRLTGNTKMSITVTHPHLPWKTDDLPCPSDNNQARGAD